MEYGLAHSPSVQREAALFEVSRQDYKEAVAHHLPSLSAYSSATWTFGRLPDPRTNEYINESKIFGNRIGVEANLTLFSGFSLTNSSRLAYVNRLVGMERKLQEANSRALDIVRAYYDALFRGAMVQLASEQLSYSERMVAQLERMSELGMKSRADVAEVKAKKATDSYTLTSMRNEQQLAMVALKQAISFPQSDSLSLPVASTDTLRYAPISVEALYTKAFSSQPSIRAAELLLRASLLKVYVAKGALYPSLSVGGGYSTTYSKDLVKGGDDAYSRQLKDLANHFVEVRLRIPLFNGLSSRSDVRRREMERHIERANFSEAQQKLYAEVARAVSEYDGAREALAQAREQREAQQFAYQTNERKYAEGLISIVDLHSSANNLLRSKAELVKAQMLYLLCSRVVAYYGGDLFVADASQYGELK